MSSWFCSTCLVLALPLATALPAQSGFSDPSFGGSGFVVTAMAPPNQYDFCRQVAVQVDGSVVVAGVTHSQWAGGNAQWVIARYLADGTLDPAFGQGGVTLLFGQTSYGVINGLEVDGAGRILAAGSGDWPWTLVRLSSTGQPDASFGSGGVVQSTIGNGATELRGMVLQPDGKVVAAGVTNTGKIALARYLPNGTFDNSFGKKGTSSFTPQTNAYVDLARGAMARQADGKIVLGGSFGSFGNAWALFRATAAGSLDTSFGSGGVALLTGSGRYLRGVKIQPDGRIVSSGHVHLGNGDNDIAVARFLTTGAADGSFGSGGFALAGVGVTGPFASAVGNQCVVQADGRILIAGAGRDGSGAWSLLACRLLASGAGDPGFGLGGMAVPCSVPGLSAVGVGIAVAPTDGKIVVAGVVENTGLDSHFMVARWFGN